MRRSRKKKIITHKKKEKQDLYRPVSIPISYKLVVIVYKIELKLYQINIEIDVDKFIDC